MFDTLKQCMWTPDGVICPDEQTYRRVHRFLRELILDRHLYLNKAVGFKVYSPVIMRRANDIEISRHENLAESYVEMSLHIQDKIFLDNKDNEFVVTVQQGEGTIDNSVFRSVANQLPVTVLHRDPHIARVIKQYCTITVRTSYFCGYIGVERNSKYLDSEYFPLYTDYSIQDYVRVLPPMPTDGFTVRIKYFSGMSSEQLQSLIEDYRLMYTSGKLKGSEKKWLSGFML